MVWSTTRCEVAGQQAFMDACEDRGQQKEMMDERYGLLEMGVPSPETWRIMMRDPRFMMREEVDMEEEEAIVELDRLVKSESACSLIESITWVAENARNPRARAQDAPGKGVAWNMYKHITGNPAAAAEFWKTTLPKLLPSNREMENQARYADDGSTQIDLANRIRKRIENGSK